jgi:hypothetical protein
MITTSQIRQYLTSRNIPVDEIAPLFGGSGNFVWRITTTAGQNQIIKHAEPFVADNHQVPFCVERMDFEALALKTIPGIVVADPTIRLPALLLYDKEEYVLGLEDVGEKMLQDVYQNPRLNVQAVGARIGRWIARLHAVTTEGDIKRGFNNATSRFMYRYNYNNLHVALASHDFDPALGERINAKYGALLQTDETCLCHGDLWPGNILFSDEDLEASPEKEVKIAIIDWEAARLGNGVTDVGQFAAEAWMLDRFRGGRGLQAAFLGGYVSVREFGREDRERVAVHFGMHIAFWSTIYVSMVLSFASTSVTSGTKLQRIYSGWKFDCGTAC